MTPDKAAKSRRVVTIWDEPMSVVEEMLKEKPNVYFMDGHEMSGSEAWRSCLHQVLSRMRIAAAMDLVGIKRPGGQS